MVVTLGEDQVKHVVEKLEGLRLELLKLRSIIRRLKNLRRSPGLERRSGRASL